MQNATKLQNSESKDHLIRELQAFMPYDEQEREDVQKTIAFLQDTPEPDCFLRSHFAGHVVASALLLSPDLKKTLLTHHAVLNMWLQFGGHADGSADMAAVALRETQEESGIEDVELLDAAICDVEIQHIPDRPSRNEPAHLHYDIRYFVRAKSEKFVISTESKDLRWFTFEDIMAQCSNPSLRRIAKKWKAYTG